MKTFKDWQRNLVDALLRANEPFDVEREARNCGMDRGDFDEFVEWRRDQLAEELEAAAQAADAKAMAAAIASCPDDRKTQDGKPTTDYLTEALGREVSAAERDAALADEEDPLE